MCRYLQRSNQNLNSVYVVFFSIVFICVRIWNVVWNYCYIHEQQMHFNTPLGFDPNMMNSSFTIIWSTWTQQMFVTLLTDLYSLQHVWASQPDEWSLIKITKEGNAEGRGGVDGLGAAPLSRVQKGRETPSVKLIHHFVEDIKCTSQNEAGKMCQEVMINCLTRQLMCKRDSILKLLRVIVSFSVYL